MNINEDKLRKNIEPFFTQEWYICSECGHPKESHYWNGGGNGEYSGYDACRAEGCKCKCLIDKNEIKKEIDNEGIEKFFINVNNLNNMNYNCFTLEELKEEVKDNERTYKQDREQAIDAQKWLAKSEGEYRRARIALLEREQKEREQKKAVKKAVDSIFQIREINYYNCDDFINNIKK